MERRTHLSLADCRLLQKHLTDAVVGVFRSNIDTTVLRDTPPDRSISLSQNGTSTLLEQESASETSITVWHGGFPQHGTYCP
jgi:hypothetical protein